MIALRLMINKLLRCLEEVDRLKSEIMKGYEIIIYDSCRF